MMMVRGPWDPEDVVGHMSSPGDTPAALSYEGSFQYGVCVFA